MTENQNPPSVREDSITVNIEDEMRGAYLDYAMSVIIGRALPDVRDGLKPVHRRALYAMYDLGNTHDKPYKKSARVVGDVIGKYHPHGDTAVYDTIVRMAQDFSLRYPLVDGQGNFGSVDGDPPAAMRYTEVRMEKIAGDLLADIEKETVDFGPNYDESLKEPLVFPARFPNLLVNGSGGIAVGMATNIPPHNMAEVIDACLALIQDPALKSQDLLQYVKGPDFPTAGIITGTSGIKQAYLTGRGVITVRAKAEIEKFKGDRERIVIAELPYQVNKAKLIEKIADLVRDKEISSISDLRDESDRDGLRVVIDIKKGEDANVLLNQLYKLTPLQDSFGITMLAIHQGQPKIFNLRDMIWAFVEHRKDVVLRRTAFELRRAEARAHILEGLKIAVENIDAVVELIKKAKSPADAKTGLMTVYSLSDLQAQAILDLRLQRLTGLERDKILQEYNEILKLIAELKAILDSEQRIFQLISDELNEIKTSYGDPRRTSIEASDARDFNVEDLIADEETLVTITHTGYIKRTDPGQFKAQHRGGKGIKGATTHDTDFVRAIYRTTTHSYLLCFTDLGKLYWLKVYQIPEVSREGRGKAIVNLIPIASNERVVSVLSVKDFPEDKFVVLCSSGGAIKKTALSEFGNVRKVGIIAMGVKEGDALLEADLTDGKSEILLLSRDGQCIRFDENDVRPMGRTAGGVIGMDLAQNDKVVAMEVLDPGANDREILTVSENGYGKRTPISEYRQQSRGGKGILAMKTADHVGAVLGARQVKASDDVMLMSSLGKMIRIKVEGISTLGRVTQGVRLMQVGGGEKVTAIELIAEEAESGGENGTH